MRVFKQEDLVDEAETDIFVYCALPALGGLGLALA